MDVYPSTSYEDADIFAVLIANSRAAYLVIEAPSAVKLVYWVRHGPSSLEIWSFPTPGVFADTVIALRLSKKSYSHGSRAGCDLLISTQANAQAVQIDLHENEPSVTVQCLDLSTFVNDIADVQEPLPINQASDVRTDTNLFKLVPIKTLSNRLKAQDIRNTRIGLPTPLQTSSEPKLQGCVIRRQCMLDARASEGLCVLVASGES